ncbi:MAG: hypothetical protein PVH00_09945 [Gemmatimonadota bacterium]|jgi:hypothetical protein
MPAHVRRHPVAALVLIVPALAACRGTGRLAEYDFRDRTLAVRSLIPPHPQVLTGPYFLDWPDDPVQAVIRAGTRIAREVEASQVRARLDSAAASVDVSGRLADRAHDRAAFHLRAERVDDERVADFVIEVLVREYGIEAKEWNAAAHFFVDARLVIIDGRDGTQVWDTHVKSRDPIAPAIFGPGAVRDVVTARALAAQSVGEIRVALERLADYSADRITERLRDALEKVQRDRIG